MTRILLAIFLMAATLMAAPLALAQPELPKVLAFFDTGGEIDHQFFSRDAIQAFGADAKAGGYSFAATSDWGVMSDAGLKDVKVVMFFNDQPHTQAQREAFRRYMDNGGRWMGFHGAGFPSASWPWFSDFLGVKNFGSSNWPALPARVNIEDGAHPVTQGVPSTFIAPIMEWYAWSPSPRANPDIHVLMSLDKSNFPLGIKNMMPEQDVPVVWTNRKYRMVYFNFGHGDQTYKRPELPRMAGNGLRWLLGQ